MSAQRSFECLALALSATLGSGCYLSHASPLDPPQPESASFAPFQCPEGSSLRLVQTTPPSTSPAGTTRVGDHLFVADRWGMRVMTLDGATVSHVATPGEAYNVVVSDGIAFVPDRMGLATVDVSTPTHPVFLDYLRFEGDRGPNDVAVAEERAYAAGHDRVTVVDVSDPYALALEETIVLPRTTDARAMSILFDQGHLYVAFQHEGVVVLSTTPTVEELARVDTPGWASDLSLVGALLAVADRHEGLRLIDVADPRTPRLRGGAPTQGDAWGVASMGGYVALTDSLDGRLRVFDVADPEVPRATATYESAFAQGEAVAVSAADDRLLLSVHGGGLEQLRLDDGGRLERLSSIAMKSERVYAVAVLDGSLAVARQDGVHVYRLDDRPVLEELGVVRTETPVFSIAAHGSTLFAGRHGGVVEIIDVSGDGAPQRLDPLTLASGLRVGALAVVDGLLLVGGQDTGRGTGAITAFTLDDPGRRARAWRDELRGAPLALRPGGGQLAIAQPFRGAELMELSGARARQPFEEGAHDVALLGPHLWVAGAHEGLTRLRRTPAAESARLHVDTHAVGLHAHGPQLGVAGVQGREAVSVRDATRPDAPVVERCDSPGLAQEIWMDDERAIVADWFAVSLYTR